MLACVSQSLLPHRLYTCWCRCRGTVLLDVLKIVSFKKKKFRSQFKCTSSWARIALTTPQFVILPLCIQCLEQSLAHGMCSNMSWSNRLYFSILQTGFFLPPAFEPCCFWEMHILSLPPSQHKSHVHFLLVPGWGSPPLRGLSYFNSLYTDHHFPQQINLSVLFYLSSWLFSLQPFMPLHLVFLSLLQFPLGMAKLLLLSFPQFIGLFITDCWSRLLAKRQNPQGRYQKWLWRAGATSYLVSPPRVLYVLL